MYTPSDATLRKYAEVLIRFALNSGRGIKRNEVVYLVTQVPGLPLARRLYETILACGAHAIVNIIDDGFKHAQVHGANRSQLMFFPRAYYRGLADSIDHWVRVLADRDPMYLRDADPGRIILSNRATKPFRDWLDKKEDDGKFTWTLCLYGTEGNAREAGMSLPAYWNQIRRACFLDHDDPVGTWRGVFADMKTVLRAMNALPMERLHVRSKKTDLWMTLGEQRRWLGGSGRNIPSFEIFTSPDWRGTSGTMFFDLPLYRYGNIIRDITLEFRNGRIVRATAAKNEALLHEMLKQKNADRIGEFSLTDRRFSRITRFMADTLYDENFGGRYGNTHLAVGKSYHDTYAGDIAAATPADFKRLGFNDSVEHTDIIATSDRTVTAFLRDGSSRILYEGGEFLLQDAPRKRKRKPCPTPS